MVTITINGQAVEAPEGTSVLDAATAAGVTIPTLCYLKDLNCIGSCRVCLVDVEGEGLAASCNTAVREGMRVRTDTPQVAAARRANLQAIMDDHRALCATCVRQDTCALRDLASTFNLTDAPGPLPEPAPWDADFPLQRDSSKCIKCMRCVAICEKVQHCAVWDFTGVGPSTKIIVRDSLPIAEAGCALCGQCITHCPTGALTARDDVSLIMEAILDPAVETVVQVAPAVRTAWGEGLGLSREEATPGRLAAALHAVGFDKVFDTDFAADLTIMEEGSEFVEFLGSDAPRPMFTSCCPGWVRFVKQHYPQFTAQLSSAKSPHQMMGAVVKNTLAAEADEAGKRLFVVSVMPCVAKKYECDVPELSTVVGATHGGGPALGGLPHHRREPRFQRLRHYGCNVRDALDVPRAFHRRRHRAHRCGQRPGEYVEAAGRVGIRGGRLRLRRNHGMPGRMRGWWRPAHPVQQRTGPGAGRRAEPARRRGQAALLPREPRHREAVRRLDRRAAVAYGPRVAAHRPGELADLIATLVAKLVREHTLSLDEYAALIDARTSALADELAGRARETCEAAYGDAVFARGLIEFTNVCKNDCYYCGIRRSNRACERYCLAPEQILACADAGWQAGFRTFVLQGGEDPAVTDEWLAELISALKAAYPGCAVTLSVGERSRESYRHLRAAGADRYLLRHETATAAHYRQLHPAAMTLQRRMACLSDLREAGFAVGAGFMVGSPFQTTEHLAADLAFIQEFRPEMCGIGPFVPHRDTPFAAEAPGTVELTCYLLSLVRLAHPTVLLPATTALEALDPRSREKGILAGANVVMPNLSPPERQGDYALYDGKPRSSADAARKWADLAARLEPLGRRLVEDRGDPAAAWASVVGPAAASVVSPARGAVVLAAASRPVSAAAATAPGSSSAASFPSTFPPVPSTKVNPS